MLVTIYYIYPKRLAGEGHQCSHFSNCLPPQSLTGAVIKVPVAAAFEIAEGLAALLLLCQRRFLLGP